MSFVSVQTKSEKAGKSGLNTRFTSLFMRSQRKMCKISPMKMEQQTQSFTYYTESLILHGNINSDSVKIPAFP